MNKVAVDYKGKHFVIQDEDTLDDFDILDEFVDVEKIVNSPTLLASHVYQCIYYGIPAYLGKDETLRANIKIIEKQYHETFHR